MTFTKMNTSDKIYTQLHLNYQMLCTVTADADESGRSTKTAAAGITRQQQHKSVR